MRTQTISQTATKPRRPPASDSGAPERRIAGGGDVRGCRPGLATTLQRSSVGLFAAADMARELESRATMERLAPTVGMCSL